MSKYSFLIHHAEYIEFLQMLRNTGVVHIKEKAEGLPEDEQINRQLEVIKNANETLKYLKSLKVEPEGTSEKLATEIVDEVKDIRLLIEHKKTTLQSIQKDILQLKPWGEFSWELVSKLESKGRFLHFFSCNKSKFNAQWKSDFDLFEIKSGSSISFVVISENNEVPNIDADIIKLPQQSLGELAKEEEAVTAEIEIENAKLKGFAAQALPILDSFIKEKSGELDFRKVELQSTEQADSKLKFIEGWVPEDAEEALVSELNKAGAYYQKSKATLKDNVPVLLKNNAFTKLFEMVGSLYSLPSYREIDLTPFFAPFFMLFFGFCLGDAGYGLLMMVATIILRFKAKPNMKPVWSLGFMFGLSTVIMGLIGGTFFGVMLVDLDVAWMKGYRGIIFDQDKLMIFSIVLGVIQIVFGMCLKAARAIKINGIKYALSTIGWIIIIVGVGGSYVLSMQEIIGAELSKYMMLFFGGLGGILALFFNSPGKNIFLNFGLGLWDAYGTATGMLGDVLSYIRLFALGLSSAVLGSVFNQLAFDLTGDIPVLSQLFTVLILLVGHSINFFMAALGSFVHPLRLTFVEFYKNTGFEGGGKKYTPFKAE